MDERVVDIFRSGRFCLVLSKTPSFYTLSSLHRSHLGTASFSLDASETYSKESCGVSDLPACVDKAQISSFPMGMAVDRAYDLWGASIRCLRSLRQR